MKNKIIIIVTAVVVVILVLVLIPRFSKSKAGVSFNTAKVSFGTISHTVSATGTVEPISEVAVGTQVSGVIQKIYVDFNSVVKKGQLIAEIDKTNLQAQVDQSKATLFSAQNEYDYQLKNFNRSKLLYSQKSISVSEFEKAEYQLNTAKANLDKARYDLTRAQISLGYASIYSPIDGVILSRSVDEGQTVAASFNTPTLFTIANDLSKMQVLADIDEADIGQVKTGQEVTFTVDAFPDDVFRGIITQVRLQPQTTSNVVTYKVVIEAPNPEFKLMPGLTATVTIFTFKKENVLTLPLQALNYKPTTLPGPGFTGKPEAPLRDSGSSVTVWVKDQTGIHPVPIRTGATNAVSVEILSGLKENDEIVLSENQNTSSSKQISGANSGSGTTNPFMPQRPGSNRSQTKSK